MTSSRTDPPATTSSAATPTTTEAAATSAPSTTAAETPEPYEIEVEMADFSYIAPTRTSAGLTRITASNEGAEVHQLSLARLDTDTPFLELLASFESDPGGVYEQVTLVAGPQSVIPGASQSAETVLEPGRYAMFCAIPSPTDGIPHAAKGMVAELEVTGETGGVEDPAPGAPVIGLVDYGFDLDAGAFTGSGTYRVRNDGGQPHEISMVRLADGATLADATSWLSSDAPPGPRPFSDADGVTPISPGQVGAIDLDLAPGEYLFVCYLPDATDGVPHFAKGMIRQVTVG